jgi:hypothetical protein
MQILVHFELTIYIKKCGHSDNTRTFYFYAEEASFDSLLKFCHGLAQFILSASGIILLSSTSFPVHNSLVSFSDIIYSELLVVSLMK